MKRSIPVLLSIVIAIAFTACETPDPGPPIGLTVHIDQNGTILVDGKPGSLEDVKQKLAAVQRDGTVVKYSRANPEGAPPPNARSVLAAIVEAKVPVQLAEPNGS